MAKLRKKISFTNGLLTKENGVYFLEEFNSKNESTGRFNLNEYLDEILNIEGVKLSFDTTDELDGE